MTNSDVFILGGQAKAKWKNLRDTFRNELKKTQQQRSGDEGGSQNDSTWPWFKSMIFLKDIMTPRKMLSNIKQTTTIENLVNPEDSMTDEIELVNNNTSPFNCDLNDSGPSMSGSGEINQSMPPSIKKTAKKRSSTDTQLIEIEKQKLKLIEKQWSTAESHDDNYHFSMSILPMMRSLPQDAQLRVRIKMQEILLNEIENQSLRNAGVLFATFTDEEGNS